MDPIIYLKEVLVLSNLDILYKDLKDLFVRYLIKSKLSINERERSVKIFIDSDNKLIIEYIQQVVSEFRRKHVTNRATKEECLSSKHSDCYIL